jgi:hypothetical protein
MFSSEIATPLQFGLFTPDSLPVEGSQISGALEKNRSR